MRIAAHEKSIFIRCFNIRECCGWMPRGTNPMKLGQTPAAKNGERSCDLHDQPGLLERLVGMRPTGVEYAVDLPLRTLDNVLHVRRIVRNRLS